MDELEAVIKKVYVKERNEILAKDDPAAFVLWATTKGVIFKDQKQAEMTRHKTITACELLPEELKARSRKWLEERGYQHLG